MRLFWMIKLTLLCLMMFAGADVVVAQTSVPAGYAETLRWYHVQAEAGDPRAQFLLAIKYETGTGVPQDREKARELYNRAARQGHADAQFKLATILASDADYGVGSEDVRQWYRAAALQGHGPAQFNLGLILLRGARDADGLAEAISWIMRAEGGGVGQALGVLEQIKAIYPETVVADARMLASLVIGKANKTPEK